MKTKPWLKQYDKGVPHTLAPYPQRTLMDYVADTVRERPDHPALFFKGLCLTYGQLDRLSNAFASALVDLKVKKGDRLALLLPNCPQFIIAELGAWKAGAIVVPFNPIYTEHELSALLANSGAETIVVLTPLYQRVKSVQAQTAIKRAIATNIKEYFPPVLRSLFTLAREKKEGHQIRLEANDLWLADLLRANDHVQRPDVTVSPEDPAVILMSGGTTGTPKGVVGLHRSFVAAGLQLSAWLKPMLVDWQDIIMLPLPLFHVFGNVGAQSVAFIGHNPLSLIPDPRDLNDILQTIRQLRPAFFSGVPTLFIGLLNHRAVKAGRVDLRSIKICFSGAAPLMAETKERFEALTGGRIIEGYSLTEAMMACAINPVLGKNKIGSIGMPLPDVELCIVDAETGEKPLTVREVGEIIMRAPQVTPGYWQNASESAQTLRSHGPGDPWLYTGDLGYVDDEGYFFLVDRKKDLIKVSGFQVWPREIEEVLASHPAVAEVAVAGVPDARKGEVPQAWVVLRSGVRVTADDLRNYCRERLAPYKVPARFEFCDDLPKTMIGKVLRRMLVAQHPSET
jgi:long-chain acyl-CoA synthetase